MSSLAEYAESTAEALRFPKSVQRALAKQACSIAGVPKSGGGHRCTPKRVGPNKSSMFAACARWVFRRCGMSLWQNMCTVRAPQVARPPVIQGLYELLDKHDLSFGPFPCALLGSTGVLLLSSWRPVPTKCPPAPDHLGAEGLESIDVPSAAKMACTRIAHMQTYMYAGAHLHLQMLSHVCLCMHRREKRRELCRGIDLWEKACPSTCGRSRTIVHMHTKARPHHCRRPGSLTRSTGNSCNNSRWRLSNLATLESWGMWQKSHTSP